MKSMAEYLRFNWVDAYVAGFSEPNYPQKIEFLLSQGIRRIVTLTKKPLPTKWIQEYSLTTLHIPMHENGFPTKDQLKKFTSFVCKEIEKGNKVGIHCKYGVSRTGMMLAFYLMNCQGYTSEEAIKKIRSRRPLALQSSIQLDYLKKREKEEKE